MTDFAPPLMRLHLYPSMLTRELHRPSLDCPCRPFVETRDVVVVHNRLPEEAIR